MATVDCETTTGPMMEPLLRLKDLQTILGAGYETIRAWRMEGRIPPPDFSAGHPRWRRETIERWLASGRAGEVIE